MNITNPSASELYPYRVKIPFPLRTPSNLVGLIIGPRGSYQKRLEEESGCKILIRGRNLLKQESVNPQVLEFDKDDNHIMVMGDSEAKVVHAKELIEAVLYADEPTRNKIRLEQLRTA